MKEITEELLKTVIFIPIEERQSKWYKEYLDKVNEDLKMSLLSKCCAAFSLSLLYRFKSCFGKSTSLFILRARFSISFRSSIEKYKKLGCN